MLQKSEGFRASRQGRSRSRSFNSTLGFIWLDCYVAPGAGILSDRWYFFEIIHKEVVKQHVTGFEKYSAVGNATFIAPVGLMLPAKPTGNGYLWK